MKLELKHIAPYLPYGLNCQLMGRYGSICLVDGASLSYVDVWSFKTITDGWDYEDVFPILRPLSDLTKEIDCSEVMGEKIVPIVELAVIADCDTTDDECVFFNDGVRFGVRFNIENDDDSYTHEVFAFDDYNTFGKHKRKHKSDNEGDIFHCPNQYKIYQKLFEWHFDVFGLIKEGLAIDINTI